MADWTSMLPGAPPMANPQAAFQATRMSNQDAQAKALENRKALYEQELQRSTQALFSQSIDESGKPNLDRFLQLAAKSPFGAAAHAQAMASLSSQLDATKKGAETAVMLGATGIEAPWSQRKPSDSIRQDTTRTPAIPEKGIAEGIQGMRYTPPNLGSPEYSKATPEEIGKMSPTDRTELVAGLRTKGFVVDPKDHAAIARAINEGSAAEVAALTKGTDPTKPMEGLAAAATARATAPKTALDYQASLIQSGREAKGQRLGQASGEFGLAKGKTEFEQAQGAITKYRRDGIDASQSNIKEIQDLHGRLSVLDNGIKETSILREEVKKGHLQSEDSFSAAVAPLSQALAFSEDVRTESGSERLFSTFRSSKSFGALAKEASGPLDLLSKAAKNAVSPQSQQEYLSLIEQTFRGLKRSGITASQIDALPRIPDTKRKPSDRPGGGRTEPTYKRGKVE
jgi:hypothetical protein